MAAAARARRRSTRELPRLVARAVAFVWRAGRRPFTITVALQVASAVLVVAQVVIAKLALDAVVHSERTGSTRGAVVVVVLLAVVMAAAGLVGSAMTLWQRLLGDLAVRAVWQGILDVTRHVELARFESPDFYDHLERVRISAVARPLLIAQGLLGLVGGLAGTAGVALALLAIQPILVPLLFLAGVPLWLTSKRASRLEFAFVVGQTPAMRVRQYLTEVLTGRDQAKEIRAFGLEDVLSKQYDESYDRYIEDLREHIGRRQRLSLVGTLGSTVLTAATLALLLWLLATHRISLAQAGAAVLGVRLLAGRVGLLFGGVSQLFESGLFLQDYDEFLAMRPQPVEAAEAAGQAAGQAAPLPEFRRLDVEDVTFAYPGAATPALSHVSMTFERGQVVALVGENGSGKTTLAKLLAALYEPGAGRIAWDGTDLRELDPDARRRQTAAIFQDFVRYHLSATQNIGLGRPEALDDHEGIVAAATQSGAHGFLARLPRGYETILSKEYDGGVDLSLGQWQRVALARAFFRDAPFIILDEPSASLDARAEHQLFASIRSLLAGRTVLLISHRFSTVRSADHIYVLDKGSIVEHGDHDGLMAAGGLYAELFTLQASAYLTEVGAEPGDAA